MITPTLTIARNTLVESLRQPIFFVVLLVSGAAQYLNTAASAYSMGYRIKAAGDVRGDDMLLFDMGLATIFVGGILLAAFIATAAISREIDNKTILTVVAKPIGRPAVIFGKYLGITAAMLIGTAVMVLQFLLAVDHGVMTTAADDVHWPVVIFGSSALLISVFIAAFGNFWYGWSFNQVFVLLLLPLTFLAYIAGLPFDGDWSLVSLEEAIKAQVLLASLGVILALLVMSAVATAASTRLGQVMTVVVCAGVFILGLISNHFIGRHAIDAELVGRIVSVERPGDPDRVEPIGLEDFDQPGETLEIRLEVPPALPVDAGDPFYFGPSPDGLRLVSPPFPPPGDDLNPAATSFRPGTPSALIFASFGDEANDELIVVKQVGSSAVPLARPPEPGDAVFRRPTEINPVAMTVWALLPNFHNYWLADAVTQASPIPPGHLGLVAIYAFFQIGVCLAIATLLFQGRDVG